MDQFKQYRNKNKHIVIPCTREQVISIFKGYGICDDCNGTDPQGYLLPALAGRWYCPKCYKDWEDTAVYFLEDVEYEEKKAMQIIKTMVFNNVVFMTV